MVHHAQGGGEMEGWREVEVGGAMHEIEKREHTVHID